MFIDEPATNAAVHGAFTIAGWALDPQAAIGNGIDAVHVWARSVAVDGAGSDPFFLGAAILAAARPDVAAAFGGQFDRTGYSLSASLPAGEFDLIVYVHSARTGRWEDARVVRVTGEVDPRREGTRHEYAPLSRSSGCSRRRCRSLMRPARCPRTARRSFCSTLTGLRWCRRPPTSTATGAWTSSWRVEMEAPRHIR